jgi:recombinational DNA repair protein (RecF pathway)
MDESNAERCGKCGEEIDPSRRVDFTLKDGTRVCDSCFVKGTGEAETEGVIRRLPNVAGVRSERSDLVCLQAGGLGLLPNFERGSNSGEKETYLVR